MKRELFKHIIIIICAIIIVAIVLSNVFNIINWIHDCIFIPEKNVFYILYTLIKQAVL